ncbi:MAG: carboxypeptidase regulatory-like domain-containing protein [Acidobacteria bacterium]|nr:carboxypeptidase regulatory-like domain-containing protein [Acidobacteriota bacterium]
MTWRLLSIAALGAVSCFGQAFTANLTGLVTDPNNAAVPGVTIKLKNVATNETRQAKSGTEGRYTFSQLLPGGYELTAEMAGFRTVQQRGITLVANQSGELNIALQLGEVTQTVDVAESVTQVDSQTANQSVTLDKSVVADLPLNARNPFALVHTTAGVVAVRTGISQATQDQNHNRFAMNGGRDESALILLDGVPATTGDWSALIIAPSVDSVQEMQVVRNTYEAQFGKSGGGVVSMVTKGGSDSLHGSAFDFLRNYVLDANLWANNRAGISRPKIQRNQFGGNLSGPVWKSKRVYFFGGYEGVRQGNPGSNLSTVPTLLQRQGDFSQTLNGPNNTSLIYDPFTTRTNPAGAGSIRDPFPGNRIPQNMFDPIGRNVVALYPVPNQPGDAFTQTRNFAATGKTITTNDRFDVRVDWARSDKHTFYTRVSKAWQENVAPVFFGNFADSNFSDQNPRHHVTIGNTFTPTPTLVLNVLIGSGRWREDQDSPSKGLDGGRIGYPASLVSQFQAQTIPQFNFDGGYATLGNARFLNTPRDTHNLQVNVTKERGLHSIKFGFMAESAQLKAIDDRSADFSFGRGMTSGPLAASSSSTSGNAIASLLLGTGSGGSAPTRIRTATNQMYYAGYAQDSWRVSRRLTLNYGLRYEVQKARTERFDRFNYFDHNASNPFGQKVGLPLKGGLVFVTPQDRGLWATDNIDLSPRLGIAYKLTDKLVVRAGYGIYYLQTVGGGGGGTDGFSTSTTWVTSRGGDNITPQDLLRNPFPQGLIKPVGNTQGLETLVGQSITAWQRPHPSGYVQNYSLDIQYEFGRGAVVELGYAGNQSRKLLYGAGINLNQLPANLLSVGAALDEQVNNPFFGQIAIGPLSGRTVARNLLLRPYPQFQNVNQPGDTPGASAGYNALLAKVTKRFSGGLNLLSTFQWSKAIDNASETQGWELDEGFRNYNNIQIERSISGHDVPRSWVTALVYDLPVGKGKKFGAGMNPVANAAVGGWQVSAVVNLADGLPLQFYGPNLLGRYGFGRARPNISNRGALHADNQGPDLWFNRAALSDPAPFTVGNASRWVHDIRYGATKHSDIAILKNFRAFEHYRAQFRAELFNAFNRPQFGRAGTDTTSPGTLGKVSGTTNVGPRNIQLGLKIDF